jgi:MFS family permease
MFSDSIRDRFKFFFLSGSYTLGVFNDGFFRNSAILLAIGLSQSDSSMKGMEGIISFLFTVPYLLFSSWAGWLADRYPKRRVIVLAKAMEFLAMLAGAAGIYFLCWPLILVMVFIMGTQACLFSPALNGSIPEFYPAERVNKVNSLLKVLVTVMILGGIVGSGVVAVLDNEASQRLVIAAGVLIISAAGWVVSLGVPFRPAAEPGKPMPLAGPLSSIKMLWLLLRDRFLASIIFANVFVWFAGQMLILLVQKMAVDQFKWGKPAAGMLLAVMLFGIAAGGLLSNRIMKRRRWFLVLPAGTFCMGVSMALVWLLPGLPVEAQKPVAFAIFAFIGLCGGAYMIPCETFIQVRPRHEDKGTVIAAGNFAVFSGISLAGLLVWSLGKFAPNVAPTFWIGAISLLAALKSLALASLFLRRSEVPPPPADLKVK